MINSELVFVTKAIVLQDIIDVVDYNLAIGFEKITIFNNESFVNFDYFKKYSNVKVIDIKGFPNQTRLYTEVCKVNMNFAKWICLQDDDETLYIRDYDNVNEFLEGFNNFAAVSINLKEISYSKAIYKDLTNRCTITDAVWLNPLDEVRRHVTTIVRPDFVLHWPTPHIPVFEKGFSVMPDKTAAVGPTGNKICDEASFYHYALKDYLYYIQKVNRGCADDGRKRYLETWEEYQERIKKTYTVKDTLMREKYKKVLKL
jgi:hypothetical protein